MMGMKAAWIFLAVWVANLAAVNCVWACGRMTGMPRAAMANMANVRMEAPMPCCPGVTEGNPAHLTAGPCHRSISSQYKVAEESAGAQTTWSPAFAPGMVAPASPLRVMARSPEAADVVPRAGPGGISTPRLLL